MAELSLNLPVTGEAVTTADPKVVTAFQELQSQFNGHIAAANLEAEAVTSEKLAKALKEQLQLTVTNTTEATFTAKAGELVNAEKAGAVITLPSAATSGRVVGVFATQAGAAVKLKTVSSQKIFGGFVTGVEEISLALYQGVLLQANGTYWMIVAGEPKREAVYGAATVRAPGSEFEPSATRPTFVVLRIAIESGGLAEVFVGGVEIAHLTVNSSASQQAISFICPAGVKWKVGAAGVSGLTSSYLAM